MTSVVDHLVRLGLSEYEAKAYVAIVAVGEGTVREISAQSGVPRSRAYDVLERLADKGLVEVGGSSPRSYRANDPLIASNQLMEEIRRSNDEIQRELGEIGRKADNRDTPIWTVKGDWAIDHKVAEVVDSAEREVAVLCFNNRTIVRYARLFSDSSTRKRVTLVVSQYVDNFNGLLGDVKVMRLGLPAGYPFDIDGALTEKGFVTTDGRYCIEMLVRSDGDVSILLTREGDARRAIVIIGTILNFFSRESTEHLIRTAKEVPIAVAVRPKKTRSALRGQTS